MCDGSWGDASGVHLLRSLSEDVQYASHYCEENVYKIAEKHMQLIETVLIPSNSEGYVIFVSNECKETPLWSQRLGDPVCWDYHVVYLLVLRSGESKAWILDSDSSVGFATPMLQYLHTTFKPELNILPQNRQLFRVVPAGAFIAYFASDRSHMQSQLEVAAPHWRSIRGHLAATAMNLLEYTDIVAAPRNVSIGTIHTAMADSDEHSKYGVVLDLQEMLQWASSIVNSS